MSAYAVQITNDVISLLNGHSFSPTFTAAPAYSLNLENHDLSTLTVLVSPIGVETEQANRAVRAGRTSRSL